MKTLAELISTMRGFERAPAVIAIRGAVVEMCSFADLSASASGVASGLVASGLRKGDVVGLIGANSAAWVAVLLGVIAAGGTALPLDPDIGAADLDDMISESRCKVVFANRDFAARRRAMVAPGAPRLFVLEEMNDPQAQSWRHLLENVGQVPPPAVSEDDAALLVYTSGTTGRPKAVPLTHRNITSNLRALGALGVIGPGDRALLPIPLHHVYPLTVGLLTPLAAGAAVVFPSGFSGPELLAALQCDVTHLVGVPRLFAALSDGIRARIGRKGPGQHLFAAALTLTIALRRSMKLRAGRFAFRAVHRRMAPKLRWLVSGGAALDPDVEWTLLGLGWEVLTGYGLTETAPILTFNRPGRTRVGSAGTALPGVELRIADPDSSGIGEVQAKGPNVFSGYRGDPAASAAAFTPDGWFRTGDLGSIDREGCLHLVARTTETIVLPSGEKVFPEAIEDIYGRLPVVREVAILPQDGSLAALVVPKLEAIPGGGRIRDVVGNALTRCAVQLPAHHRLSGFAITTTALPRTRLGKIRRHLLPDLYRTARQGRTDRAAAPLSAEDEGLLAHPVAAKLWAWLNTRFADSFLSPETNLQLDLGVDSLEWVTLTLEIDRAIGVRLDEAVLTRVATVRDLLRVAVAAANHPQTAERVLPESDSRLRPPSPGAQVARLALHRLNRGLMRFVFDLKVCGADRVPTSGPCLLCPNHTSYLDPFALAAALPPDALRQTSWAGWTKILFTSPWRRLFSRIVGVLPTTPERPGTSLELAAAILRRRGFLAWFPEGGRSPDGRLQRFQPGTGVLVRDSNALIVPVAIDGTYTAWPSHRRWPRMSAVRVRFGQPIAAAELSAGERDPARIAEQLRTIIAALLAADEVDRTERRSAAPGDRGRSQK
jgi:long-chain acyl-CoA synthetase